MDLVGFLFGFGVLQGLILAIVLLVAPSGHRLANVFMAGLVVAIALNLLQSWLIRTGYYLEHPTGALLIPPLDFVWGPLLYLYAYSLTSGSAHWRQAVHFLPATLMLVAVNSNFRDFSEQQQSDFLAYLWSVRVDEPSGQQITQNLSTIWRVWVDYHLQGSMFALHFGIYSAMVLAQINHHNQRLQQHFSSLEDMNLRWLRSLTVACLLFLFIFLVFNRGRLVMAEHFDVNALGPSTPSIFLVVLTYLTGIYAIFQPNMVRGVLAARRSDPNRLPEPDINASTAAANEKMADDRTEAPTAAEPAQEKPAKYQRSALSMEDASRYKVQLMTVMQEEELYLDSELTLPDLASKTGLTPHQVSQVINGQMNQNFFSFVNTYRIQLAKDLMSDEKTRNMPIVELAVEVGFKSKSSFYDAFKKATQMTPTQFKKSVVA